MWPAPAAQTVDLGALRARARMLIVGCGAGRLACNYLDFARQYGIRYFTFIDISESQLRATCGRVFNHLRQVNVSLHPRDAVTIPGGGRYDVIVALFFVTAESAPFLWSRRFASAVGSSSAHGPTAAPRWRAHRRRARSGLAGLL